jgi:4'-phosphopantetheinyl transferase
MGINRDSYIEYMSVIFRSNCIRCYFDSKSRPASKFHSGKVDIFFAETKDLSPVYPDLKNYIVNDERLRADKFQFEKDRETYITCHAILRLVLAQRLNIDPLGISFRKGVNQKPYLIDNPAHFNITHTREAFAVAVSKDFLVGIDLELIKQDININSIAKSYFSKIEREYILESEIDSKNRFFQLWTRKEALLKALGTGIVNNLKKIEVSGQENFINRKSFDNLVFEDAFHDLFIYSNKINDNYLSIAIPYQASLNFFHLNSENIFSFFI